MALKIPAPMNKVNPFLADVQQKLAQMVIQSMEDQLEAEVEGWLHRRYHQRRCHVARQSRAQCQRCGTQQARAFSRSQSDHPLLITAYKSNYSRI
jgi:hypothetical protein